MIAAAERILAFIAGRFVACVAIAAIILVFSQLVIAIGEGLK